MLEVPIMFTLKEVFFAVIYVLLIGLLYFLILFIRELYVTVKKFNLFCIKNKQSITTIVKEGSNTLQKTNNIVKDVTEPQCDDNLQLIQTLLKVALPIIKNITSKKE